MSDENITTEELAAMRREIREWGRGMRWVLVVMMVVPLYYATRVLLVAPEFEKVFEDMLGSREKLPGLTKMVIDFPALFLAAIWGAVGCGGAAALSHALSASRVDHRSAGDAFSRGQHASHRRSAVRAIRAGDSESVRRRCGVI